LKIGYIEDNESVEFAHAVTLSVQAAAKKAGIDLISCDPQEDPAKALQCAITLKQQHVQGLINYQDQQQIAAQLCAQGPKVPVIAISIAQEPCQTSFTGADNKAAGSLAGKQIGEWLKTNYDCKYDAWVSLEATKTGTLNTDRMGGYRSGFESVCGKIHGLRVLDAQAQADTAQTMMTDALTALPDAHRIIMVSVNDGALEGAFAAASAQHRLADVVGAGQGLDSSGVCAMRKYPDQWLGDTAYFPEHYGSVVIPAIIKAAQGETLPANIPAKIGWVTPKTLDNFYAGVKC
jgi:ribose transport system substrate-binding protein